MSTQDICPTFTHDNTGQCRTGLMTQYDKFTLKTSQDTQDMIYHDMSFEHKCIRLCIKLQRSVEVSETTTAFMFLVTVQYSKTMQGFVGLSQYSLPQSFSYLSQPQSDIRELTVGRDSVLKIQTF